MKENPAGESKNNGLKLLFHRCLRLEFRRVKITTDPCLKGGINVSGQRENTRPRSDMER